MLGEGKGGGVRKHGVWKYRLYRWFVVVVSEVSERDGDGNGIGRWGTISEGKGGLWLLYLA